MNYDYQYDSAHKWVKYHYGKASRCENKKCSGRSQNFHWAKIQGKEHAKKRENYIQLCVGCHFAYDGVIQALALKKLKKVKAFKNGIIGGEDGRIYNF